MSCPDDPSLERRNGLIFLGAAAALLVGMLAVALPLFAGPAPAMPLCDSAARVNCVVDGDTLWLEGVNIRLENIDTPEIRGRCRKETMLAWDAAERLSALLSAGTVIFRPAGRTDRYGRAIGWVAVDGKDIGEALIDEGLARPWRGKRESWC